MKTIYYPFIALFLLFNACIDSNKSRIPPENPEDYLIIEGTVENGMNLDIDSVAFVVSLKAGNEYEYHTLSNAPYVNGSFKLYVPRTLNERFLRKPAEEFYIDLLNNIETKDVIAISDESAKVYIGIPLRAYKDSKFVGYISFSLPENKTQTRVNYFYADKPFSLKGKSSLPLVQVEYDVDFKPGWNLKYEIFKYGKPSIIIIVKNDIPEGLKWHFYTQEESDSDITLF